jgi:hypothetical protein
MKRIVIVGLLVTFALSLSSKVMNQIRMMQNVESDRQKLMNLISKSFWVNESGVQGDQYVAFRTKDNHYLGCSQDGKLLGNNTKISKNELFTPEFINETNVALKSSHGGYIGLENREFKCNYRKIENYNHVHIVKNAMQNMTRGGNDTGSPGNFTTGSDTIALKFPTGYLALENRNATLVDTLKENAIFMPPKISNMTANTTSTN